MQDFIGSYWSLLLLSASSVALAMGGLWFTRRNVSHEILMEHHDVAGAMLSVVGALYAVVLGLVVVGSITKFEQARTTVEQEANALRDIFFLSEGLGAERSRNIEHLCIKYAKQVCDDEWTLMSLGQRSPKVDRTFEGLIHEIVEFRPINDGESNVQQSLLSELNNVGDSRAFRTVLSTPSFDPIIWSVLVFGGIVLVVFTYFFGVENLKLQLLMTGLVTVVLVLNMLIVAMFAYPFSGDVRVWPKPFKADLSIFEGSQPEVGK